MAKEINLKIDQNLLDKVRIITKNKYPLRNITSYAEATREALIEYVKKNLKYQKIESNEIQNEIKVEEAI
jgi:hypothetical protein